MMEKEKKKIIIDTDCGSDDAMAIAMALNDPTYEIQLITTVSGSSILGVHHSRYPACVG